MANRPLDGMVESWPKQEQLTKAREAPVSRWLSAWLIALAICWSHTALAQTPRAGQPRPATAPTTCTTTMPAPPPPAAGAPAPASDAAMLAVMRCLVELSERLARIEKFFPSDGRGSADFVADLDEIKRMLSDTNFRLHRMEQTR